MDMMMMMMNKDSLYHDTAFLNQVFLWQNKTWRKLRDFLVKRVSVLSVFIATAYDILRFSTISKIKK